MLQLLGYVVAYLANTADIYELLPMTIDRLLMQMTPVAALLIGLLLGDISGGHVVRKHARVHPSE